MPLHYRSILCYTLPPLCVSRLCNSFTSLRAESLCFTTPLLNSALLFRCFTIPHCAITSQYKTTPLQLRTNLTTRYITVASHHYSIAVLFFDGKHFESPMSSVSPLPESGISSVCEPFSYGLFICIRHNRDNKGYT